MTTVTLQEAQAHLEELIYDLAPGDEIAIIDNDRVIARVISPTFETASNSPRKLGFLAGSVSAMAADFDAPLEDMQDYMY